MAREAPLTSEEAFGPSPRSAGGSSTARAARLMSRANNLTNLSVGGAVVGVKRTGAAVGCVDESVERKKFKEVVLYFCGGR